MRKNKFLVVLVAIFSIFVFSGCANIEYQRITDNTGQIVDRLIIELNDSEIESTVGIEKLTALKQDIERDFNNYVQVINYLKPQLQSDNPHLDFSTGIIAENSRWMDYDNNTSKITLQIQYKNSEYLKKLNGSDDSEEDDDNTKIVSNLFISKYMMYSPNAFSSLDQMGLNGKNYLEYYSSKYSEFSLEDINLTQVYGTTDDRLKSEADYKETIQGINYHLWEIDTAEDAYKTMELTYYYTTAVGTGWYIVALGLSLGLAIILILVYIIRRHINKKYKIEIIDETNIIEEDD